ncbi:MAG: gluconeogenesis factor YvcK family protein [Pseudomonadota bacterium]
MTITVTTLGGGTGSFNILSGLRSYSDISIQAIVSMMDSGGDSGRLRDEFGVLPPGDLRRCLVALSEETQLMRELFSYRFTEEPLSGRNFGNLFFLALSKTLGSQQKSLNALNKILKIRGEVIAVTWDDAHIVAHLADGSELRGEADIDVPKYDRSAPITKVLLEPAALANERALKAIAVSDYIVLAPGDLFTSTIPNLLVDGIADAINAIDKPLVYVCNLMTKPGETDGFSASQHVAEIVKYGCRAPDAVLVHGKAIPQDLEQKYKAYRAEVVNVDVESLYELGVKKVIFGDVMSSQSLVRHDPEKIGEALVQLFSEFADGAESPSEQSTNLNIKKPALLD